VTLFGITICTITVAIAATAILSSSAPAMLRL